MDNNLFTSGPGTIFCALFLFRCPGSKHVCWRHCDNAVFKQQALNRSGSVRDKRVQMWWAYFIVLLIPIGTRSSVSFDRGKETDTLIDFILLPITHTYTVFPCLQISTCTEPLLCDFFLVVVFRQKGKHCQFCRIEPISPLDWYDNFFPHWTWFLSFLHSHYPPADRMQ